MLHTVVIFLMSLSSMAFANEGVNLNDTGGNVYFNCADQGRGAPLLACERLVFDLKKNEIRLHDVIEKSDVGCTSKDYFCISSIKFPIAVPKNRYSEINSWNFTGIRYVKEVSHYRIPYSIGQEQIVDIVSARNRNDKVILTFWYSETRGVVAVGLPAKEGDSGDVFYLGDGVGLFAQK